MENHLKPHIQKLLRYQTSLGRDLKQGLRLDRNEKVSDFSDEILQDIFSIFSNQSLSSAPEAAGLYQKIAQNLKLDVSQLYISSGITEGIRILFETLTNPGENVIVLDPTYPMYMIYAKFYQVEYRKFQYQKNLQPDWDSLRQQIDKKTSIVFIPNPNLPIESCFTIEEIKTIAKMCQANGTWLVVDEAYHYFGAPSTLGLISEFDNIIVMRTFSKAYGLAGIRLGFMVSQKDNIAYFSKTRSIVESNTLSMGVAEYFLNHPQLMQQHVLEVKEGSQYIQSQLNELNIKWHGGHFTNGILIFLENQQETKNIVEFFREIKIYIRGSFEAPFDCCVRISIGPPSVMEKFIDAFKSWLDQKQKVISKVR